MKSASWTFLSVIKARFDLDQKGPTIQVRMKSLDFTKDFSGSLCGLCVLSESSRRLDERARGSLYRFYRSCRSGFRVFTTSCPE